ncbi:MAG TPA: MoxR family ATPase [Chloroflexota bacterium]|nr:MoxR family ATPase [Chloroflexota bacterium]
MEGGGALDAVKAISAFGRRVTDNVARVIVGKDEVIRLVLVALLCDGHVLLEDVPGTGKTMLARAVSGSLGCTFKRLQCTPDLLPSDVTGVSVYNQKTGDFQFHEGPAFVNILLADEINRATPRTQSALLEAMGERQITADGLTRELPRPFLVLATQNPIEYEGTFPLPEAQMDRFLIKLRLGNPSLEEEKRILRNQQREHPIEHVRPVALGDEVAALQRAVWEVHVDDSLVDYIGRVVGATRIHPDLAVGASTRGTLALFRAAQALAALYDRSYVTPDDVKALAPATLCHRVMLKAESELRGRTAAQVVRAILDATAVPIEEAASTIPAEAAASDGRHGPPGAAR